MCNSWFSKIRRASDIHVKHLRRIKETLITPPSEVFYSTKNLLSFFGNVTRKHTHTNTQPHSTKNENDSVSREEQLFHSFIWQQFILLDTWLGTREKSVRLPVPLLRLQSSKGTDKSTEKK
jgi:hypothetical protein